jgi:hypothetical protein
LKVSTLLEHLRQADPEAEVIFNMDGSGRVFKGVHAVEVDDLAIDHGCSACHAPHGFREFEVIDPKDLGEIDPSYEDLGIVKVFVLWP